MERDTEMNHQDTHGRLDLKALERWFEAEAEGREAAAEEALTALFDDLPAPPVPVMLTHRLEAVAEAAAVERQALRAKVFGLPRRWVERLAASLLLVTGVVAALSQAVLSDSAGPALERLRPARVISTFAEGVFSVFSVAMDWAEAGVELFYSVTQLSGAAATVASTVPVATALGAGSLLAAFAFKLLRDLIGKERGYSHADTE